MLNHAYYPLYNITALVVIFVTVYSFLQGIVEAHNAQKEKEKRDKEK